MQDGMLLHECRSHHDSQACAVHTYLQDALAAQDASRLSWPLCKRRIHHPAAKTVLQ